MRVLTVRQPWAHAIIYHGKDVENRVRNIAGAYRGPIAIHAAKRLPTFEEHWAAGTAIARITGFRPLFHSPDSMGAIVGVVDLVNVQAWSLTECGIADETTDHPHAACSPWAFTDGWHLELANPRALGEPIPYKGALGLRTLDDATEAQILAAVA